MPRIPPGLLVANELGSVAGFGAENPVVPNRCWREEAKLRIADWKGVKNRIYLFFLLEGGDCARYVIIDWYHSVLFMNKMRRRTAYIIYG